MAEEKKSGYGYGCGGYGKTPKPKPVTPPEWLNIGKKKPKPPKK